MYRLTRGLHGRSVDFDEHTGCQCPGAALWPARRVNGTSRWRPVWRRSDFDGAHLLVRRGGRTEACSVNCAHVLLRRRSVDGACSRHYPCSRCRRPLCDSRQASWDRLVRRAGSWNNDASWNAGPCGAVVRWRRGGGRRTIWRKAGGRLDDERGGGEEACADLQLWSARCVGASDFDCSPRLDNSQSLWRRASGQAS